MPRNIRIGCPALHLSWRSGADSGVVSDLLLAALDDFSPIAIESTADIGNDAADEGWRVFFRSPVQRDAAAASLRRELGDRLAAVVPVDVPDEGWARRSQESLHAIQVGRIVVAPPWDQRDLPGADLAIVIDPSTGFGTGHHETTRLCLRLLQRLDVSGRSVIDVGTGSGVLAIAAAKLGAARVIAADNDAEALRNARENVIANACADRVEIVEQDLGSLSLGPADIVAANLTAGVIERNALALGRLVAPLGSLVISGFGPGEAGDLAGAFPGLAVRSTVQEGAWAAQVFSANL